METRHILILHWKSTRTILTAAYTLCPVCMLDRIILIFNKKMVLRNI